MGCKTCLLLFVLYESEKIGDVYVVMYSAGCDGTETSQTIRAHHSVIIDVYGESTLNGIVGFEFHMGFATPSTLEVTNAPDVRIMGGFISIPKTPGLPVAHNPNLKTLKWMLIGKVGLPEKSVVRFRQLSTILSPFR
jgi:hypothetical protein